MPVTVSSVFGSAGLSASEVVRWGEAVPMNAPGVYVVALGPDTHSATEALGQAPLNQKAIGRLLERRPEMSIDGSIATVEALEATLQKFWSPHEVVLYIGRAGTSLKNRVNQYYKTPLGANKPHAGGWWLKTLINIDKLYVHYAPSADDTESERRMLKHFADQALPSAGQTSQLVLPFANLRAWNGLIKPHSIRGATGELKTKSEPNIGFGQNPEVGTESSAKAEFRVSEPVHSPSSTDSPTESHRSQRVTAADLKVGQVRFPKAAKSLLPQARVPQINVEFRGRPMTARWDPRNGPDRERSGVLGFGRYMLDDIVTTNEVLTISISNGRILLL